MCRLVSYLGVPILLESIIVQPENSLLKQSICALESKVPTNGDGFGLGWYNKHISDEPGLFKSISPAWNDKNLLHLAAKIESECFFAHVRAASAGGVTQYNCHPFIKEQWMLMHNGGIYNFEFVKRHIRRMLDDDIYNWIQGETDSEHLFALFLQLAKGKDLSVFDNVGKVLFDTFTTIHNLVNQIGKVGCSYLNVCLTDGKRIIATRYCTDKRYTPETMHLAMGSHFEIRDGVSHMIHGGGTPQCVLVTSERLNAFTKEWHDVPAHHMIMINEHLDIRLRPL